VRFRTERNSAGAQHLRDAVRHHRNIGVHGEKVDLHLERLWSRNISITPRLITHRFGLHQMLEAYDVFGRARETGALKVIIATQE
jgi:threonine dehydrogenase-like Zn-dependent dehydrogenase